MAREAPAHAPALHPHLLGSFGSVKALAEAIIAFLAERKARPKRYVWNAKGEDILRKIVAARNRMEQICA